MARSHGVQASPEKPTEFGGRRATIVFGLMLFAFVAESQLTEYVESTLKFRQPYLLFYIAHSAMALIFPLHLLYLHFTGPFPVKAYLLGLSKAVKSHLTAKPLSMPLELQRVDSWLFPRARFIATLVWCTIGITIPALLWFAALTFASVSDVTAIWNSNAFWAYVISVKLKHQAWEPRRLLSVVGASLGVLAVVYGSKQEVEIPELGTTKSPFFGNMLTLIASFIYGLYQVLYNMYAVPPSEAEDGEGGEWRRLSISSTTSMDNRLVADEAEEGMTVDDDIVYPPPFGLYANALTSGIGLLTVLFLWIPLPLLHITAIEPFVWPGDLKTSIAICGIALTALTFLATFMILLGVWGPIVTSVGNLLTIVLVIISDLIFGNALDTLTMWSILGSGMIVCAFAVLAYESFKR